MILSLSRRATVPALALLSVFALGCGGKHPTASVSGKVTVGGKNPLPGGNVTFYLASDPTKVSGAVIKSDGTFDALDVPVGECKVVVDNSNLDLTSKGAGGMPPGAPGPGMMGPGSAGMGGMPGIKGPSTAGPPANVKDKMNGVTKGAAIDPGMDVGKDTGTKKYVKIEASFAKMDTTPLKHTVVLGENKNVNFDVK